jgi:hypothetical protein
MRTSEPVRIGVPTSRPNSVSESPSSSLMRTPMIEKIVQTAKQTVKAMVDIESARVGEVPGLSTWGICVILSSFAAREVAGLKIAKKKLPARGRVRHPGSRFLIGSFASGGARHWTPYCSWPEGSQITKQAPCQFSLTSDFRIESAVYRNLGEIVRSAARQKS